VTVTNSSNTTKRFTREPVYMVYVGASADSSWVIPNTDEWLDKNLTTITRGKSKEMSSWGLPQNPNVKNGGNQVAVYLLRRSLGSQTNTMFRELRTLANQLQVLIAVSDIDDSRVNFSIDEALQAIQDDDDSLGGFVLKVRRLSAGQIRATWFPIGESDLLGSPKSQYVADKYRPYVLSSTRFRVGQSIYPYLIDVSLSTTSCCQAIGIKDFVSITAPLPQGNAPLPEPAKAPLPQGNVVAPLPPGVPPTPTAQPNTVPLNGDSFPCSRAGLNRSNLCVLQPYPAKRGNTVSVVWRIADFKQGEFDSGDGRGYIGPINAEMRIDLPKVNAPRTIRLRWIDSSGRENVDSFAIQVVD
jgi:hypothetical protein